jgi:transcriptional regulator with XRE-family HTH domain
VGSLSPVRLGLTEKLRDRSYRTRFFAGQARTRIAMQIKALREKREMNQTKFAVAAKMKQSAVSRIEQADYSGWTFKTLLRTAAALDARLLISFEPAEDVIAEYEKSERLVDESFLAVGSSATEFMFTQRTSGETLPSDQTPTHMPFLESLTTTEVTDVRPT